MAIKFKYAECSVGPVHGPRQFPDGVNLFRQGRIDIKSRSVLPVHGATQVSQLQLTLSMSSKCTLNAYSSIPDNVGAIGSEFAYHALDLYCSIRLAIIPKLRSVIRAHIRVYTYVEFASTHAVTGKAGKKLTLSRGSQVDSSCGNPFHLTRTDQEPLTFVFFTLHKHNHARAIAIVNEVRTRRIAQLYSSLLHVGRRVAVPSVPVHLLADVVQPLGRLHCRGRHSSPAFYRVAVLKLPFMWGRQVRACNWLDQVTQS